MSIVAIEIDNNKDNFATKIKQIRKERNMSQDRFGKKLGLSGKTISAYETGRAVPSTKVLENISNTYEEVIFYSSVAKKDDLYEKIENIKKFVREIENILGYGSKLSL